MWNIIREKTKLFSKKLFLFGFLFFISLPILPQNQTVRIKGQGITIKSAFRQIENQTNFTIAYDESTLDVNQRLKREVKSGKLTNVLLEILKDTDTEFVIRNNHIVIRNKGFSPPSPTPKTSSTLSPQESKTIQGQIVDAESNEPIIGASVVEKGTTNGILTDVNGNFNLIIPMDASLTVSYIGYSPQEINTVGQNHFVLKMHQDTKTLDEVVVVGYGQQKKATLTGAITSINTEELVNSPNSSVANMLSGKITGISTVQTSGQPGKEDPAIYVRGIGSLTPGASSPLILVDGVERPFTQMDPNEIESISVLKDASATAVFGVRGANGVIMVTTRRGEAGKAKISTRSSVGFQMPTRILETADSYTYALVHNEMRVNDNTEPLFSDYVLERFRLKDEPIIYPSIDWTRYLMNKSSIQTQHNINISGGSDNVKYFVSMGFLYQNGLFKQFPELDYDNNYKYKRYNYRTNLDLKISKTTSLKIGIGGIIGNVREPNNTYAGGPWYSLLITQPFAGAGILDGKLVKNDVVYYPGIQLVTGVEHQYGRGTSSSVNNRANFDLEISQNLNYLLEGLSLDVKGAYNTFYVFNKDYVRTVETYVPFYTSTLNNPGMDLTDPNFDKSIIYRVEGKNTPMTYRESNSKGRDWYFESSLRYNNQFGDNNFGGMILYTQNKKYYPRQYPELPTAYVGLVGRLTYDYKTKYLAEFNVGYNGSENFAPGMRFGVFPAASIGYIVTEEGFMKNQSFINYLKLRGSLGLVGNDNIGNNRYLYLKDSYSVDVIGEQDQSRGYYEGGYNFGYDNSYVLPIARENRIGNPNITWEKSLKKNIGFDLYVLNSRFKVITDFFHEKRVDILINRGTTPIITSLTKDILPVVNLGRVNNWGYEIGTEWSQSFDKFKYWINANISYSKNKIVFMDEVEPNEKYMIQTGRSVGEKFGYVANGFYSIEDFDADGNLMSGPDPIVKVSPGDVKYKDLNGDNVITPDDQTFIGASNIPSYIFGLNHGWKFNNFTFQFNWIGATKRDLLLVDDFRKPFRLMGVNLLMYHVNERWTPATANTATFPRITSDNADYNYNNTSSLYVKDGSYFRLKNLTIGYDFNKSNFLRKMGISQLSLQFTGYNLLTFDKFKLIDPENTPTNTGYAYPITKVYNLGVNINF